ncbi:MAG: hypothetical protein ACKO23_03310 [Gemmataceae bacterium]
MDLFGIPSSYWFIGAILLIALEVVLVWAVTALGDCPPWGIGKLFLVAFIISSVSLACLVGGLWLFNKGESLWAPEQRASSMAILGSALLCSWIINSLVYSLATPWSVGKSTRQALIQLLLRAFLVMLVGGILMVLLAWLQISVGKELRAQAKVAPFIQSRS